MRILLVTDSMDLGGAETHILTLARALKEEGEQVEVCSQGGRLVELLARLGVPHHTIPFLKRNPFGCAQTFFRLARLLRQETYDVVHAHARYPAFLCNLLRRFCRRLVTTCHAAYPNGPLARLPWHGQHVFAVSEDLRERLLLCGGLSPQAVSVVRNAVYARATHLTRTEAELRCGLVPSSHRIVAVHRMDHDTVLPAKLLLGLLPTLRSHYADAQLVLVGDGDAMDALRALQTDGVVLVGGVTDPAPYLAAADVLVGVSRSALEAMVQGVPVILAGREGFGGLVTEAELPLMQANNFTGRGMQNLDKKRLYDAIVSFFSQPNAMRERHGKYMQAHIKRLYHPQLLAVDTLRIYRWIQPRDAQIEALFVGYLGCDNLGDDAMLLAARERVMGGVCLAHHPHRAARTYGMPCIGKYNLFAIIKTLLQAKKLVLGGGSLLQNKTSSRSLFYYSAIFYLAGLCGARRVILANGLGPLRGEWAQRVVRSMLSHADRVSMRDPLSLALARRVGVTRRIELCADPALLCRSVGTEAISLPRGCMLVCLREGVSRAVIEAIPTDASVPIVFLAMQPCDRTLAADLAAKKNGILLPSLTVAQLRSALTSGQISAVLTMRYHLALLAAQAGLPCLAVGEDPKLFGLYALGVIARPIPAHAVCADHVASIQCGVAVPFASAKLLAKAIK